LAWLIKNIEAGMFPTNYLLMVNDLIPLPKHSNILVNVVMTFWQIIYS